MNALRPDPPGPPASSPSRPNPPRLLDRVREAIRHPAEMGAAEITQFLTDLAVNGHVSASTQNQAFSALLFLYQQVLQAPLEQIRGVVGPTGPGGCRWSSVPFRRAGEPPPASAAVPPGRPRPAAFSPCRRAPGAS